MNRTLILHKQLLVPAAWRSCVLSGAGGCVAALPSNDLKLFQEQA